MTMKHFHFASMVLTMLFLHLSLFENTVVVQAFSLHAHVRTTTKLMAKSHQHGRHLLVVNAEQEDATEATDSDGSEGEEDMMTPTPPPLSTPPAPRQNNKYIMNNPLMASLTRTDPSTANLPTKNIPLLGEVPVDGSLALLIPAAGIAILGFVLSIVVAINSKDEIVSVLSQVTDDVNQAAVSKSSQVYDESVCRGICSSQQQDLEGLKGFMDRFSKQ